MHEVVAGEQENLLNSGVVSGGDAFREGVVGSGVGVPGGASAERTAAGMGFKHMVAASLVEMCIRDRYCVRPLQSNPFPGVDPPQTYGTPSWL